MAHMILNQILDERGLSIREAAALTTVSKSTIHSIRNDELDPKLSTLELLAKGLEVKITDLFESDYK